MQSISRRFLLVPERVAVSPTFACKLVLNVAGDAAPCRWSPPEHADTAWDGLSSPAAAMFSFGLMLMYIWGEEGSNRLGPFPLKDQDEIRSCASRRSAVPIHSPSVAGRRCSACSWGSPTLSSKTWPRCRMCPRCTSCCVPRGMNRLPQGVHRWLSQPSNAAAAARRDRGPTHTTCSTCWSRSRSSISRTPPLQSRPALPLPRT